jgi:hypothetical protein
MHRLLFLQVYFYFLPECRINRLGGAILNKAGNIAIDFG